MSQIQPPQIGEEQMAVIQQAMAARRKRRESQDAPAPQPQPVDLLSQRQRQPGMIEGAANQIGMGVGNAMTGMAEGVIGLVQATGLGGKGLDEYAENLRLGRTETAPQGVGQTILQAIGSAAPQLATMAVSGPGYVPIMASQAFGQTFSASKEHYESNGEFTGQERAKAYTEAGIAAATAAIIAPLERLGIMGKGVASDAVKKSIAKFGLGRTVAAAEKLVLKATSGGIMAGRVAGAAAVEGVSEVAEYLSNQISAAVLRGDPSQMPTLGGAAMQAIAGATAGGTMRGVVEAATPRQRPPEAIFDVVAPEGTPGAPTPPAASNAATGDAAAAPTVPPIPIAGDRGPIEMMPEVEELRPETTRQVDEAIAEERRTTTGPTTTGPRPADSDPMGGLPAAQAKDAFDSSILKAVTKADDDTWAIFDDPEAADAFADAWYALDPSVNVETTMGDDGLILVDASTVQRGEVVATATPEPDATETPDATDSDDPLGEIRPAYRIGPINPDTDDLPERAVAVMDHDGNIYADTNASTHLDVVAASGLDPEDIMDAGFIRDGRYVGSSSQTFNATDNEDWIGPARDFTDDFNRRAEIRRNSPDDQTVVPPGSKVIEDAGEVRVIPPDTVPPDMDAVMDDPDPAPEARTAEEIEDSAEDIASDKPLDIPDADGKSPRQIIKATRTKPQTAATVDEGGSVEATTLPPQDVEDAVFVVEPPRPMPGSEYPSLRAWINPGILRRLLKDSDAAQDFIPEKERIERQAAIDPRVPVAPIRVLFVDDGSGPVFTGIAKKHSQLDDPEVAALDAVPVDFEIIAAQSGVKARIPAPDGTGTITLPIGNGLRVRTPTKIRTTRLVKKPVGTHALPPTNREKARLAPEVETDETQPQVPAFILDPNVALAAAGSLGSSALPAAGAVGAAVYLRNWDIRSLSQRASAFIDGVTDPTAKAALRSVVERYNLAQRILRANMARLYPTVIKTMRQIRGSTAKWMQPYVVVNGKAIPATGEWGTAISSMMVEGVIRPRNADDAAMVRAVRRMERRTGKMLERAGLTINGVNFTAHPTGAKWNRHATTAMHDLMRAGPSSRLWGTMIDAFAALNGMPRATVSSIFDTIRQNYIDGSGSSSTVRHIGPEFSRHFQQVPTHIRLRGTRRWVEVFNPDPVTQIEQLALLTSHRDATLRVFGQNGEGLREANALWQKFGGDRTVVEDLADSISGRPLRSTQSSSKVYDPANPVYGFGMIANEFVGLLATARIIYSTVYNLPESFRAVGLLGPVAGAKAVVRSAMALRPGTPDYHFARRALLEHANGQHRIFRFQFDPNRRVYSGLRLASDIVRRISLQTAGGEFIETLNARTALGQILSLRDQARKGTASTDSYWRNQLLTLGYGENDIAVLTTGVGPNADFLYNDAIMRLTNALTPNTDMGIERSRGSYSRAWRFFVRYNSYFTKNFQWAFGNATQIRRAYETWRRDPSDPTAAADLRSATASMARWLGTQTATGAGVKMTVAALAAGVQGLDDEWHKFAANPLSWLADATVTGSIGGIYGSLYQGLKRGLQSSTSAEQTLGIVGSSLSVPVSFLLEAIEATTGTGRYRDMDAGDRAWKWVNAAVPLGRAFPVAEAMRNLGMERSNPKMDQALRAYWDWRRSTGVAIGSGKAAGRWNEEEEAAHREFRVAIGKVYRGLSAGRDVRDDYLAALRAKDFDRGAVAASVRSRYLLKDLPHDRLAELRSRVGEESFRTLQLWDHLIDRLVWGIPPESSPLSPGAADAESP